LLGPGTEKQKLREQEAVFAHPVYRDRNLNRKQVDLEREEEKNE